MRGLVLRSAAIALAAATLSMIADAEVASAADPGPGEYEAARARAKDIGGHLGASLASANAYERLLALEYARANPAAVGADLAPRLAELIADRTKVQSLQCMSCEVSCRTCDGCWGLQGSSDCGPPRDVSEYARYALTALASGPLRTPLADALGSIALRSDPDAAAVATLMPSFGGALCARVRVALDGPDGPVAGRALRLFVRAPPGQCGDGQLAATLTRLLADGDPAVRDRAALAVLVCGDGSAAWTDPSRRAVADLGAALTDPRRDLLGEFPAVASVVEPLAGAIARRMADRAAPDGREGLRLLRASPSAAASALPGLRARLRVSDEEESVGLFTLISDLGPRAAPLKPDVVACAARTGAAYWAIAALGAMRAQLSQGDRRILERAYRSGCGFGSDCEPFSQVVEEAFRRKP
jgi:hypothetical protein